MIRLNTPIESLVINLQSAGNVQYNIQYVIVRQGTRLEKSTEGLLTSSGQNVVLINDFSSGYFDITYINVTNIDPTENFISVLKKTNVSEFNLTSEAIGLKNRECTEFTSESGFKVLDQNGSFKTITESVSADGDVENSDMTYMASVPSGGTLTLPDSDIEVNGVGEGVVVSVKTINVDLNDGTDPVSPTLVTLVGNTLTITLPDIGDVTVENSDATYQVIEPSGGTLVLPDSQINVNGVDEGDVVSVKAINVDLTDGVNPVVPTSVGLVGNTLTITLPASGGGDVDIEINGVPFDTITAPATVDIPVINSVPAPVGTIVGTDVVVGDATVNVRKSDATLISAVTVEAEGVASYNVGDSSAVLKDESGNVLSTTGIKATESEDIVAPNGDVSVNSVAFDDVLSGGALNIQVRKSTGNDLIGSKQGQYWRIGDSTITNSDSTYDVDVKATESLVLPDSQINVNSVDSGDVVSVKTIDVNLEDSLGAPVTPTSVGLVGNTLTIEVPSGSSPSGVLFKTIQASQHTSYRTGDEGWRVQNGWFDYTPPTTPKSVAELDYSIADFFSVLASPLVVNGVSSTTRFVDVNGVQVFTTTGNANLVVIDKLTGLMYSRVADTSNSWINAIDDALAYSIVVNSITYDDWFLPTHFELLSTINYKIGVNGYTDGLTGINFFTTTALLYSSTTNVNSTNQALYSDNSLKFTAGVNKLTLYNSIYVRDARNLITAP
jgi:hypothetical protein